MEKDWHPLSLNLIPWANSSPGSTAGNPLRLQRASGAVWASGKAPGFPTSWSACIPGSLASCFLPGKRGSGSQTPPSCPQSGIWGPEWGAARPAAQPPGLVNMYPAAPCPAAPSGWLLGDSTLHWSLLARDTGKVQAPASQSRCLRPVPTREPRSGLDTGARGGR